LGFVQNPQGDVVHIDGLRALAFGNGVSAGDDDALYYTAGPEDGQHGLFGVLRATNERPIVGTGTVITPGMSNPFLGPVATFTDGNPSAFAGEFSATIGWGDGTISDGTVLANGNGGFDVQGGHTYGAAGRFGVDVTITRRSSGTQAHVASTALVGSINERFVAQVYRDVLRREAEQEGLDFWCATLERGASRAQVVDAIQASRERLSLIIRSLYTELLDRDADPEGHDYFVNRLLEGAELAQVVESFLTCDEYLDNLAEPTDLAYLQALLEDVIDEDFPIDDEALEALLDLLAGAEGHADAVEALFALEQFAEGLVDSLYEEFLDRASDDEGREFFAASLLAGATQADVIAALVSSAEYLNRLL
jgi:hypothetical protein